jgi:N-carbamoyl-L-amino-acid hydrolase
MRNIAVDGERLWRDLMEIGRIGETAKGGCHRLALSAEDGHARDLFCRWMREAGCTITVDGIGNIFARREGRDPARPPVMVGSHLDTVPLGGKFDGIAGVLAAVEVVRTLNDRAIRTEAPIEVVVWTNEEGSRFSPFTMGSQVFAGQQSLDAMLARRELLDPERGATVGEALDRIGYRGTAPVGGRKPGCYFELHIEQGPEMARDDAEIGIVTGSFEARYFVATVEGEQAHVGPTPMAVRHDALVAASRLILEIDRIGRAHGVDGRANAPHLELHPNVRGVIPGRVMVSCDVRHRDHATLGRMHGDLVMAAQMVERVHGVTVTLEQYGEFGPVAFDPGMVALLRDTAASLGYRHRDILTVAGHDAVPLNTICPAGMIFCASRAGGISHNEREWSEPADVAAGANVLAQAVLARAGVVPD